MKATEVTASLAESNCSLLPGLWRDSLHVTCGLTACTPKSVTSMGKLYLFNHLIVPSTKQVSARFLGAHCQADIARSVFRDENCDKLTDRAAGLPWLWGSPQTHGVSMKIFCGNFQTEWSGVCQAAGSLRVQSPRGEGTDRPFWSGFAPGGWIFPLGRE